MRTEQRLDLISIGECLVEFNREPDGRYRPAWAGDAVNTLFYAARLGLKTGFVSTFGDDLFTPMLRDGIAREGINLALTDILPGRRNGLYFIELDARGEYTFHFWRRDSAATETLLRIDPMELIEYLSRSSWLLLSGITLAIMREPERLVRIIERLRAVSDTRIAFDTNFRSALWSSVAEYRERVEEILPFVDVLLPSESDIEGAWPEQPLDDLLASFTVDCIALKRGGNGCTVLWNGERADIPIEENVRVIDATGAGDAFNAGVITGLIRGMSPRDAARLGMHVAGIAVSVRGAIANEFRPSIDDGR